MKTLGLIGGMSWESTVPYYRVINETVRERLGGLHSARLILYSVDFADIERLQQADAWDEAGQVLAQAARSLEAAGAEGLALCTNTMHKVAPVIESAVTIPLLHIADATAAAAKQAGFHTVGLLGTRFTMEQEFYRGRLRERHGLTVIIPDPADRETTHRVIYDELCQGEIRAESQQHYRQIMQRLVEAGAEGIILGCTEIGLLINPADAPVPLFDTTRLHAQAAAQWALADNPGGPSDAVPEAEGRALQIHETIPVLRIFDLEKARAFYVNFLGFRLDWIQRLEETGPAYLQLSRAGCRLHLSEHHGDGCPGATVGLRVTGLTAFHREIMATGYRYLHPAVEPMPWGVYQMEVIDPFSNRLRFYEPSTEAATVP